MENLDKRPKSRPCDNSEYSQFPTNEIGQRIGKDLHRVFCDLHDENQMALLSETTGMKQDELWKYLFVTERYRPTKNDWPMNHFYPELLGITEPTHFNPDTMKWETLHENVFGVVRLEPDDRDLANMLLAGDDFRPTILVGRVGSGKTSFLKRFIKYIAPNTDELKYYVFLHLDFAKDEIHGRYFNGTSKSEGLDRALDFMLTDYFNEQLNGLPPLHEIFEYTYKVENIERTIETWPEEAREIKRLEWYRERREELDKFNYSRIKYIQMTLKRKVVICIDNIDQWPMANQKELIKNSLYNKSWYGSGLLLVVRHNSLSELQRQISFSQFRPFKKHLTPPKIDLVVQTRLKLLQKISNEISLGPYAMESTPLKAKVLFSSPKQLVDFLGIVSHSLTSGEAEEFIRCFSNHNVRRMLDFTELYLCSQNSQIWRYFPNLVSAPADYSAIGFWDEGGVGLHTVISVAALGHGSFFHPFESSLVNLFCNNSATAQFDALIKVRILDFVSRKDATPQSMLKEGFEEIGYEAEQIKNAVQEMVDADLIETREKISDPNAILFATIAGKYYLSKLINKVAYIQHMRDGCFLPNIETPIGNTPHLEKRLNHVAKFVAFLDNQEQGELERGLNLNPALYRKFCGSGFFIPNIATHLLEEIKRIRVIDENQRRHTISILEKIKNRKS